ncbi:MAG: TIM44-like domain-containing protein [Desulfovibrionaceae bacterium]|nr:TIM44-like domain-containing protein [Desulfovibrionaceae bacterium]
MKQWLWFTFLALCLCLATITLSDPSYAARMGGGRSFGSQSTMRQPTVAPRPTQPTQQPWGTQNTARPSTGGLGGMGGLFGGLLAGTLLGSLLGGHGAGAGGGIGFIDVILFGILIWLGFKIFRKMRGGQNQPVAQEGYAQSQAYNYAPNQNYQQPAQDNSWNQLRQDNNMNGFGQPNVPAGFDVDEFLRGAKAAYMRMQSSWDQRDLNDIAMFATPAVMNVLQQQLAQDPNPSHTEIINVDAQLMNVNDDGITQRAQVFFDVLMRENPQQRQPEPVREVWHFLRTLPSGTWKLDGIQQTY